MLDLIKKYFENKSWRYSQLPNTPSIFVFNMAGTNGNFQCIIEIIENEHKFFFFSICGTNVPADTRGNILDLLNRLNCQYFLGNFEMDSQNGEIRYKTSAYYVGITPNIEFIEKLIDVNIIMMNDSLPSIMAVIFSEKSPTEAFELIPSMQKQLKKG